MPEHYLIAKVRSLLAQQATLDIAVLETLAAIFEQKLYLAEGYASSFDFCVKGLGMSEDSAARRRKCADLLRRYPALIRPLIEQRKLTLTNLSRLHPLITDDNAQRLISEAAGKVRGDLDIIIAREAPKPDLTAAVRKVSVSTTPLTIITMHGDWAPGTVQAAPLLGAPLFQSSSSPSLVADSPLASQQASVSASSLAASASPPLSPSALAEAVAALTGAAVSKAGDQRIEIRAPDRYVFRAMMSGATKVVLDEVRDLAPEADLERVLAMAVVALRDELLVKRRKKLKRNPPTKPPRSGSGAAPPSRCGVSVVAPSSRSSASVVAPAPFCGTSVATPPPPGAATLDAIQPAQRAMTSAAASAGVPDPHSADSVECWNAGGPEELKRHVPDAVARLVFERDRCCQFVGDSGRRCGATRHLQLHHLIPYALGGPATPENLTVYCRAHNLYQGELDFGPHRPVARAVAAHEIAAHAAEARAAAGGGGVGVARGAEVCGLGARGVGWAA